MISGFWLMLFAIIRFGSPKYLRLFYDIHIKRILSQINKKLGFLQKFHEVFSRSSLIAIYKSFIRPQLDYCSVVFYQAINEFIHQLYESQYTAVLVITGASTWTFKDRLYQELGFKMLQSRRWFWKQYSFYKLIKTNHNLTFMIWFRRNQLHILLVTLKINLPLETRFLHPLS